MTTSIETLQRENAELRAALKAFETQWVKLAGFPNIVDPFSGAIVAARVALSSDPRRNLKSKHEQ